jgi:hypothetical protein
MDVVFLELFWEWFSSNIQSLFVRHTVHQNLLILEKKIIKNFFGIENLFILLTWESITSYIRNKTNATIMSFYTFYTLP